MSFTVGLPESLVMFSVPDCAAPAVGVKVTPTLHCTGAAKIPTHEFELTENGAEAVTELKVTELIPELLTVTFWGALV